MCASVHFEGTSLNVHQEEHVITLDRAGGHTLDGCVFSRKDTLGYSGSEARENPPH